MNDNMVNARETLLRAYRSSLRGKLRSMHVGDTLAVIRRSGQVEAYQFALAALGVPAEALRAAEEEARQEVNDQVTSSPKLACRSWRGPCVAPDVRGRR